MLWLPTPRLCVCNVAAPWALTAADPIETAPSSNVTEPVGPVAPAAWATFAVKVTELPKMLLLVSDATAVVVGVAPGVVTLMTRICELLLR